jgi:hypothetical protein
METEDQTLHPHEVIACVAGAALPAAVLVMDSPDEWLAGLIVALVGGALSLAYFVGLVRRVPPFHIMLAAPILAAPVYGVLGAVATEVFVYSGGWPRAFIICTFDTVARSVQ